MIKSIGYACHNTSLGTAAARTTRLKNASPEKLRNLIADNLSALRTIIKWNIGHGIGFYRISSGLIPYASHPVNQLAWSEEFRGEFARLGRLISAAGMLVSMHPGQYTVLSSPRTDVVLNSLAEIEYHAAVLDLLGFGREAKITLHPGGVYGDKEAAMERWADSFWKLSGRARERILVENDGVSYSVSDCLALHARTGGPVAFDAFHYSLEAGPHNLPAALDSAMSTWGGQPIAPIVHYSNQAPGQSRGAHAAAVDIDAFIEFNRLTVNREFNLMLETKDKEQSALKLKALGF